MISQWTAFRKQMQKRYQNAINDSESELYVIQINWPLADIIIIIYSFFIFSDTKFSTSYKKFKFNFKPKTIAYKHQQNSALPYMGYASFVSLFGYFCFEISQFEIRGWLVLCRMACVSLKCIHVLVFDWRQQKKMSHFMSKQKSIYNINLS